MRKIGIPFILYALTLVSAFAISCVFKSYALSGILFTFLLPAAAVIHWKTSSRSMKELGVVRIRKWPAFLIAGLGIGILVPFIFMIIEYALGWTNVGSPSASLMQSARAQSVYAKIFMMYLSVTVEELVFRGYFLNALREKAGRAAAILLSSFLWGTGHLASMVSAGIQPAQIAVGMATFTMWGCLLCLAYFIGRKSLWLPFGVHLGMNTAFSSTGLFFQKNPASPQWIVGHPDWSPETGLLGLSFYAAVLAVLLLTMKRPRTLSE